MTHADIHIDEPIPTHQHRYEGLDELPVLILHRRRESLFLLLSGLFLGTLAMLNILGITRFIVFASWDSSQGWAFGQWGTISFAVAVGVLPYPLTFLCTDFISELYGRRRANLVVWVGLILNLWVLFILWLSGTLPVAVEYISYGFDALGREVMGPPLPSAVYSDDGTFLRFSEDWTFHRVSQLTFGAVTASMIAYLIAQLVDVQVFHFWKRLTCGKHLWLRNNGSTLVSQLVDTVAVILITHYYAHALPINSDAPIVRQLLIFIATGYVFKLMMALLDTIPFMIGTKHLVRYLRLPPPGHEPEQTVE
ncbi:MAG: queuosine precursor transporter [Phycisphaerales bacterium]|nr:queuosine precursor transporter [Phycisphaerales bacterium]